MKNFYIYCYKFCNLFIIEENSTICSVLFKKEKMPKQLQSHKSNDFPPDIYEKKETSLIKRTNTQLNEYFTGKRKVFDIPYILHGTDFQIKVWKALQTIPYGETRSYGQLAAQIENPKASRAIGMANNKNPISIIIPCHRIIGHNGDLVGYAGGLNIKQQLLDLEKTNK